MNPCPSAGRDLEFVNWDFKLYALCAIHYANFEKGTDSSFKKLPAVFL